MEQLNARRKLLFQRGSSRGGARGSARGGASHKVFTGGVLRPAREPEPSRHHHGCALTTTQARQMCKQETDQKALGGTEKGRIAA